MVLVLVLLFQCHQESAQFNIVSINKFSNNHNFKKPLKTLNSSCCCRPMSEE